MTLYAYIKAPSGYTIERQTPKRAKIKTALSILLIIIGVTSLTTVIYPLISYQVSYAPGFKQDQLIYPLAQNPVQIDQTNSSATQGINNSLDYTNSKTWFPSKEQKQLTMPTKQYNISIPRLKIKNAIVRTDSTDLKKSLIHYENTSMPGKLGNTVVFGHSVLPQFFDPSNYTTIFSTLYTLRIGDEIEVHYDGITYTYIIQYMYEVKPNNLKPLEQTYDDKYLTIITCTPPGTYLRRLIIQAVLL